MNPDKKISVAFLWHMHQPCYKDTVTGKYLMPWTRFHAVKDYFPMAALIEGFENVQATFNLVPSLVEQLKDYAENGATDTFLDLTLKKASYLSQEEKMDILDNFFKVNFKNFIEPNARYSELLIKKGINNTTRNSLKKVIRQFSDQDFMDLQALFNLVWFHSITIDEDINLKDLINKGSSYSEADKEYIVMKQREVMGQIIPLYRRLAESGRIEISATPFYHPITPLLCDTSIAKVSMPGVVLPKNRFRHPEDARWHIAEAIKYHSDIFGHPPAGMWPSEGSVSNEALSIMASEGIKWAATDEDILFNTLQRGDKKRKRVVSPDRRVIYQPYKFRSDSKSMSLIFRDKNLSDIISFNYNAWDQTEAAEDLLTHFRNISNVLRRDSERGIITIIMDGENAWEYFEDNGRTFFEALYSRLDKDEELDATTISGHLGEYPPRSILHDVFPASWINHEFRIWIGEEQDNLSWDYLGKVRKDLLKFTAELEKKGYRNDDNLKAAWKEFHIAEGSDWNWWYGGKAHTRADNPFDKLYLMHLKNIYKFLNKPIPGFLKISIA